MTTGHSTGAGWARGSRAQRGHQKPRGPTRPAPHRTAASHAEHRPAPSCSRATDARSPKTSPSTARAAEHLQAPQTPRGKPRHGGDPAPSTYYKRSVIWGEQEQGTCGGTSLTPPSPSMPCRKGPNGMRRGHPNRERVIGRARGCLAAGLRTTTADSAPNAAQP